MKGKQIFGKARRGAAGRLALLLAVMVALTALAAPIATALNADASGLVAALDEAKKYKFLNDATQYDLDAYTIESVNALENAIGLAEDALALIDGLEQVTVDQTATLLWDVIGLLERKPGPGDKTALASLVASLDYLAAGKPARDVFTDSWLSALDAALDAANDVLVDEWATQSVIDGAKAGLEAVIAGREFKAGTHGFGELVRLLLEYAELDSSDYTVESWEVLQGVMDEAWVFVSQYVSPLSDGIAAVAEDGAPVQAAVAELDEEAIAGGPDAAAVGDDAIAGEGADAGAVAGPEAPVETAEAAEAAYTAEAAADADADAGEYVVEVLALGAGLEIEPLAYDADLAIIGLIVRLREAYALLELVQAPAPIVPAVDVTCGVYAPYSPFIVNEETLAGDAKATAEFTIKAVSALNDIGIIAFRVRVASEDIGALPEPTVTGALAGFAAVRYFEAVPSSAAGYDEYAVELCAVDAPFSVGADTDILRFELPLVKNESKPVSLLLNRMDAILYDSSYENGEKAFQAVEHISVAVASEMVFITSRFDVNLDGEVTLLDVEMVRRNLGKKANADGTWDDPILERCYVSGVDKPDAPIKEITIDDLTAVLAKYEWTLSN
jgi:hypothetical protein